MEKSVDVEMPALTSLFAQVRKACITQISQTFAQPGPLASRVRSGNVSEWIDMQRILLYLSTLQHSCYSLLDPLLRQAATLLAFGRYGRKAPVKPVSRFHSHVPYQYLQLAATLVFKHIQACTLKDKWSMVSETKSKSLHLKYATTPDKIRQG